MTTLIAYALIQLSILTAGSDKTKTTTPTNGQVEVCGKNGGTGGWTDRD